MADTSSNNAGVRNTTSVLVVRSGTLITALCSYGYIFNHKCHASHTYVLAYRYVLVADACGIAILWITSYLVYYNSLLQASVCRIYDVWKNVVC